MVGLTIALLLLVPAAALSSSAAPAALQTLETPPVLNVPVYALSTLDAATGDATMNILTYAAPVGIRPARRWCISLYRPTRSHTNFAARRTGVLQLLCEHHAPLVHLLGGQSASDPAVDKEAGCAAAGFAWERRAEDDEGGLGSGEPLLPGCAAYLRVTLDEAAGLVDCGDHDAAICTLDAMRASQPPGGDDGGASAASPVLYTQVLRDAGIISDAGRALPPGAA